MNPDDGQIDTLEFVVAQAPGADSIDLQEVSVELIGSDGQETFNLDDSAVDKRIFTSDNGDTVLTENSDRAEVNIALTSDGEIGDATDNLDYDLEEGDDLSVTFTTAAGATTTSEIRVPSTIVEESVRL